MRSRRELQRGLGRRASVTELNEHFQNRGLTPLAASLDKTGAVWASVYASGPESAYTLHNRYRRMHEDWYMQQMRSVQRLRAPAGQPKRAHRPSSAQPIQPNRNAGMIDRSSFPSLSSPAGAHARAATPATCRSKPTSSSSAACVPFARQTPRSEGRAGRSAGVPRI